MKNGIEIRWHGRGGQGAKTAALLLADVAFKTGKHVQGFPEYGPERMGAPITAYNRISSDVIRVHSNIYDPDFVAVVDETLLHTVDVTAGLKKEGAIIVNTAKSKEELMPQLNGYEGRVVTIDARTISEEALGKYFPQFSGRRVHGTGRWLRCRIFYHLVSVYGISGNCRGLQPQNAGRSQKKSGCGKSEGGS